MHAHVNNAFVCLMGIGTVFVGLIAIVLICEILGAFFRVAKVTSPAHGGAAGTIAGAGGSVETPAAPCASPAVSAGIGAAGAAAEAEAPIPDRQRLIAAVTAAIAEDLGTDVTGIRVLSFKKI